MVTPAYMTEKHMGAGLWSGLSHLKAYTLLFVDAMFIYKHRVWRCLKQPCGLEK
jgi:hypothetical protein